MKTVVVLLAAIVLSLVNGCATPPKTSVPPKNKTGISIAGVAATNAVITKYDGKHFYYRKKCESCGFISPQTIGSGFPNGPFTCKSEFVCPKCGKISEVRIQKKY